MSFEVQGITMYITAYYDNPQAAVDEANYYCEEILEQLAGRSDVFYFEIDGEDNHESNEAIALFRQWMRQIDSLLPELEERSIICVDDKQRDISVYLWRNETQRHFIPRDQKEVA